MKTVYVSIGNSDNKLSQQDWAKFLGRMQSWVRVQGAFHDLRSA